MAIPCFGMLLGLLWAHFVILFLQQLIHDCQLQIKDLYSQNHWNWDVIRTVLLDQIKDYINMLCPILNEAIQNSYVWRSNLAGIYTAKEDYKWILKHNKSSSPIELS